MPYFRGSRLLQIFLFCLGSISCPVAALAQTNISGSPHDLSASSDGGTIDICNYCHLPQETGDYSVQLWSSTGSTTEGFTTYGGTTTDGSDPTQPDGISLVCLSCHDSTIAMNVAAGDSLTGSDPAAGETFTVGSHPVSVSYFRKYDPTLNTPIAGKVGDLPLYAASDGQGVEDRVECPSCHNPHEMIFGNFLRISNNASDLCRTCHNK